jgi:hypothetical protein
MKDAAMGWKFNLNGVDKNCLQGISVKTLGKFHLETREFRST